MPSTLLFPGVLPWAVLLEDFDRLLFFGDSLFGDCFFRGCFFEDCFPAASAASWDFVAGVFVAFLSVCLRVLAFLDALPWRASGSSDASSSTIRPGSSSSLISCSDLSVDRAACWSEESMAEILGPSSSSFSSASESMTCILAGFFAPAGGLRVRVLVALRSASSRLSSCDSQFE